MNCMRILLACLASSGVALAQTTSGTVPRPLLQLNRSNTPVGTIDWDAWKLSSPRQRNAADSTKGFAPTADVVHAIFPDLDKQIGFIPTLEYRKSVDGGRSFLPAVTLFQLQAQETWTGPQTYLTSENQLVFVVYQSDAHNTASDNEAVYVMASEDQGQTWKGPLLVSSSVTGANPTNTRGFDSEIKIALANGICHIVYEATPTGVTSPGEDLYYAAVTIQNGQLVVLHKERRINTVTAAGAYDVDGPDVAADRGIVAIVWSDDRAKTAATVSPNTVNNHFSVVSVNSGTTFSAETKHTKIDDNSSTGWDTRRCKVRVAVPNIYVFQEDSRNATDDNCYLSYSNDVGQTYKDVEVNKTPTGVDMDEMWMDVDNRRVVVAYRDDRNGANNALNNCFVVVSEQAGNDFATAQEVQVTSIDTHNIYGVEVRDRRIGISLETDPGESFWLAASDDGGKTFVTLEGTTSTPHGDVDSPFMTMTMDGDIAAIWIHDDRAGNSKNNVYTSGVKLPYLLDNTATNQGLALEKGLNQSGEVAFVMISQTGTQTPITFNQDGLSVYLTPDALWSLGATSFSFLFIAVVDAQGKASFPAIPNLKTVVGSNVWAAAVTISGGSFTNGTDAIRFQ